MHEPTLRGAKVLLREKRPTDALNDYRWRSDPELSQLDAATPLHTSFTEFQRFYLEELRFPPVGSQRFAIDTLDGKQIGNCMCYDIDLKRGQAELGILIGEREYWSHGYGTDAVTTLLRHIFTSTPLLRVYLHTLEWNHRARRSFEKCGFILVRTLQRNGKTFVRMEIEKEDWLKLQAQSHTPEPQGLAQNVILSGGEESETLRGVYPRA